MSFIILIIGFFFLIKGADVFVEGAASIARKFNVPAMVIGLTIVAMGTSAPEAAVSITSSLAGQNDMSVANVVGSNFFNILVVLGVSGIMAKLPVQKDTIKKDTPFLILISALLLLFGLDFNVSRIEGVILLLLFTYFLVNTVKSAKNSNNSTTDEITEIESDVAVAEEFIPYVANVTADYVTSAADVKPLLEKQVAASVRWQQTIEKLIADGADTFVEIGPGKTLSGFMRKINRDVTVYNIDKMEDFEKYVNR